MMTDKSTKWLLGSLAAAVLGAGSGCGRDARLADREIRDVTARTVTHYGVTLDQKATPQQVTYVLLRAIRDDFLAENAAARDAAIDKLLDVCAANEIYALHPPSLDRAETIYKVARRWTPTVAHYVDDFETEWDEANSRFTMRGPQPVANSTTGANECQIIMELADPSADRDPHANVLLIVKLVQDSGYWRVFRVGFTPLQRSMKARATVTIEPAATAGG